MIEFKDGTLVNIDEPEPKIEFGYKAPDGRTVMYGPNWLKYSTQLEYKELPRREINESPANDLFNDHCVIGINERMVND